MLLCIHGCRCTVHSRINLALKDVFTVGRGDIADPQAPRCGGLERKYREEDKHISTEMRGNDTLAQSRAHMETGGSATVGLRIWGT